MDFAVLHSEDGRKVLVNLAMVTAVAYNYFSTEVTEVRLSDGKTIKVTESVDHIEGVLRHLARMDAR